MLAPGSLFWCENKRVTERRTSNYFYQQNRDEEDGGITRMQFPLILFVYSMNTLSVVLQNEMKWEVSLLLELLLFFLFISLVFVLIFSFVYYTFVGFFISYVRSPSISTSRGSHRELHQSANIVFLDTELLSQSFGCLLLLYQLRVSCRQRRKKMSEIQRCVDRDGSWIRNQEEDCKTRKMKLMMITKEVKRETVSCKKANFKLSTSVTFSPGINY